MTQQVRRLAAAAAMALAPIGLVAVWLVVRDDLPDRLATHFGLDGVPDGFQSAGGFVGWLLPLVVVLGVVGVAAAVRLRVPGASVVTGLLGCLAWLFAVIGVDTLLSARGVADPREIRSGATHLLPAVLTSLAAGLLVWRLTPPGPRPETAAEDAPVLPVAPGERVVWLGSATSRAVGSAAGVVLACGVVLLAVAWTVSGAAFGTLLVLGVSLLVAGLALGWCRRVDVRVDNDGVVARLGGMPWPAFRTRIERIEGAAAEEIEPIRWGGWGHRLSRRGSAIVIRRGPGIVLHRRGSTDLAVTVDDAETGAAVISGLLASRS
ncbi:DUF1648 domain-containing protein [Nocardioides sp.]|uniref:DUF1648 domain-containing protein n=1 Tax=Nocardioides sp. TaxID=35761 RepID=UPI0039E2A144